jgi:hypothetical protein
MATLRNSTGWTSWRTKARAWFMEQGLDEVITKERPADRLLRPTTSAEQAAWLEKERALQAARRAPPRVLLRPLVGWRRFVLVPAPRGKSGGF